ncbi:MAG: DUF2399 domain-containing protein [Baekduia sp.]
MTAVSGAAAAGEGEPAASVEQYDIVPIGGVPNGLRARVRRQLRTDQTGREVEVRDRRRRTKLTRVYLFTDQPDDTIRPIERELTFLLGADSRSWATVIERLGGGDADKAWKRAIQLARGGAVEIECTTEGARLGEPVRWRLTERFARRRKQHTTRRRNERASWEERAHDAADALANRWPQLAHALRRHAGPVERQVLVYAAEDLLSGRSWAGPRAFSQVHFGTTKARDDVGKILAHSGVELEAQIELGVLRAGRTGLAGPVQLISERGQLDFTGIKGPTDVRLDQPGLRLTTTAEVLLVIENRQAAEAVSDRYPDAALVWTQGAMGEESLEALAQLAERIERVITLPDADLGGVRIAEQILAVAPAAKIVDTGAFEHERRTPWKPDSVSLIGLRAAADGPAGSLAEACLARGYPVEQELAVLDAVAMHVF